MKRSYTLFIIIALCCQVSMAQTADDVLLLKDPLTGYYGYASKVQNRKSPLRGMKKVALNVIGKSASGVIGKSEAEEIDWVVPPQYTNASSDFSEGLAAVEVGGKVGFIDLQNRFVIEPQYDHIDKLHSFNQGLAVVKTAGKYGFIDKTGKMVIEPTFDDADNFKDNHLATVKKDGKFGAINLAGEQVVPCTYKLEAAMVSVPVTNKEYREAAKREKDKYDTGHYDTLKKSLADASERANKKIGDDKWLPALTYTTMEAGTLKGIRDQYGRDIVPARFASVTLNEGEHVFVVTDESGLYGLYSDKGDRYFRPLFDTMGAFADGRADVSVSDIGGWIDSKGGMDETFMDKICDEGLAYDQDGKNLEAAKLYYRILRIDPNHIMALNNLAIMDIENKDYNQGMRKLKLAHKLAPDNEFIAENLHQAKHNRNERRWNRITTGLEIAAAVLTLAATTYATAQSIKNPKAATANMQTGGSGSYGTTSGGDGGSSSGGSGSKGGSSTAKKVDYSSVKNLDRAYEGYDDQLVKMQTYPERYSKSDFDNVPNIQRKMRDIREKMTSMGATRTQSPRETWRP